MSNSMMITMGQALDEAQARSYVAECLVAGEWLSGHVVGRDSEGCVLDWDGHLVVIRLSAIDAVKVSTQITEPDLAPQLRQLT